MEIRDPQDNSLVGIVPRANAADAERALASAWAARVAAKATPPDERARVLDGAAAYVEANAEQFAQVIATEGIKTIRESRREVRRCVETLRLSAELALRMSGETIAFGRQAGSERRRGYISHEPVGVVVAITPFNDPLNLVAHKIGPAIACGSAVILKPDERTPLSALALARALERAGLRDGVMQVLTGQGKILGPPLISDTRVRTISFTGSRATGEWIARNAGIKRLAMELGGNCATLVMADADLENAVNACVSGAFWAAGQNCLHVQRLLVQRDLYFSFRERFITRALEYRLGRKTDEVTDMGCLISEAAAQRVEITVQSALTAGAGLLIGGERVGTSMRPTVLEKVPSTHALAREEIFGPVTMLAPFDDLEGAIAMANATEYGLQAAIFTRDLVTAFEAVERLEAGAVIVNDATDYRIDSMPFGGIKASGLGREGVRWAAQEMTELKLACFVG